MRKVWLVGGSILAGLVIFLGVLVGRFLPLKVCRGMKKVREVVRCVERVEKRERELRFVSKLTGLKSLQEAVLVYEEVKPFLSDLELLLGQEKRMDYLIMLQNDTELKTNGGFSGSYAVITMEKGEYGVRFQDIYVPDGQIEGYVEPPEPVQEAFGKGEWRLRDWDWKVDFSEAGEDLRWFMRKGGEVEAEVVATLGLGVIERIAEVVGEIYIPEYGVSLSSEEIYGFLQTEAEAEFFPGSIQKKEALAATGKVFMEEIKNLSWKEKVKVGRILVEELERENILVNSRLENLQRKLEEKGWAGRLKGLSCESKDSCLADTFLLVETNMGANKANCCVKRATEHRVSLEGEWVLHEVEVEFSNSSEHENPVKPVFYGGNYISYLRFYVPEEAKEIKVEAEPTLPRKLASFPVPYKNKGGKGEVDLGKEVGFKKVGFFHTTRAGTESRVSFSYKLPYKGEGFYQLGILKQHGVRERKQIIDLFEERLETPLRKDFKRQVGFE